MQLGIIIMSAIFWMALSVVLFFVWENRKTNKAGDKASKIVKEAEKKAFKIVEDSKKESLDIISKAEKIEERNLEREDKIEKKLEIIENKQDKISQKEDNISQKEDNIREEIENIDNIKKELAWKLAEMAKLTENEARELYLKEIKGKFSDDGIEIVKKYKKKIEDSKKEVARDIILKSIQQYAWDVTSEVTTTLIQLPSDDIKGKLIWKEGRNITTFERTYWRW